MPCKKNNKDCICQPTESGEPWADLIRQERANMAIQFNSQTHTEHMQSKRMRLTKAESEGERERDGLSEVSDEMQQQQ